jgi:branched-chain amino acid transport system permease protein
LLVGMAGLLSLGQGAFYGIGAYVSAVLTMRFGVPFFLAIVLAGLVSAASSLLLVPIVKFPSSSLAVATLGFNIIVYLVLLNEDWATGGSYGLLNIPAPRIFGYELASERDLYYLCLGSLALVYLAADRLVNSRFGRALKAISQDEDAARACGVSIVRYKSKCFLVAAFTAGLAGSLYAHHARYLNPNDFTFNKSIEILIMVVVGGLGSLPGAIIGAFVIVLMPEFLRSSGELRLILFGLLVVVLMGVSRGGIAGLAPMLVQRAARWRSSRPSAITNPGELKP